jgi:hypothetical protein
MGKPKNPNCITNPHSMDEFKHISATITFIDNTAS